MRGIYTFDQIEAQPPPKAVEFGYSATAYSGEKDEKTPVAYTGGLYELDGNNVRVSHIERGQMIQIQTFEY